MAAGLTVEEGRIAELSGFLEDRLAAAVARAREAAALMLDCADAPHGVSIDRAETLEGAGPYGTGWPSARVAACPFCPRRCQVGGSAHVRPHLGRPGGGGGAGFRCPPPTTTQGSGSGRCTRATYI